MKKKITINDLRKAVAKVAKQNCDEYYEGSLIQSAYEAARERERQYQKTIEAMEKMLGGKRS